MELKKSRWILAGFGVLIAFNLIRRERGFQTRFDQILDMPHEQEKFQISAF